MKKLKIGDNIFIRHGSILQGFQKIIKITLTTAKSKDYTFNIDSLDDGFCIIKGDNVWSTITANLATKKLEKEWEETKILNWYYQNSGKFTNEQIFKIYKLLKIKQ